MCMKCLSLVGPHPVQRLPRGPGEPSCVLTQLSAVQAAGDGVRLDPGGLWAGR
jgi:hypothetical protein